MNLPFDYLTRIRCGGPRLGFLSCAWLNGERILTLSLYLVRLVTLGSFLR